MEKSANRFARAWATEAPYWTILSCDTRVWVKTRYLEKFKINISSGPIQTKFSTRKRLNTRSILLILTWGEFRRVQDIFKILLISNSKCLAKRWVKYTIVLVCVMLWRHLTLRSKGYCMRISMVVSVLKGGWILVEILLSEVIEWKISNLSPDDKEFKFFIYQYFVISFVIQYIYCNTNLYTALLKSVSYRLPC